MKRFETVRLYPSKRQVQRLGFILDVTLDLYNALLEQRREAYRRRRIGLSSGQQYREITDLRANDARLRAVYRESEDAVLHRLDVSFNRFFRQVAAGRTAGYPRFKTRARWNVVSYDHGNRALRLDAQQRRLTVPGVGAISIRKGRSVPEYQRAWLYTKNERWYACFETDRKVCPVPQKDKVIGIDCGVHVLASTSEGTLLRNPRHLFRRLHKVKRLQRKLSRRKKGGENWRKAKKKLAALHQKITHARRDYLHKAARKLISRGCTMALEKLDIASMTRSARGTCGSPGRNVRCKAGLNRSMLDSGMGRFLRMIVSKAEEAALTVFEINPRYSSQTCSRCDHVAAESRRRRRFKCVACGFTVHADVNAALVIRRRAELLLAGRDATDKCSLRSAKRSDAGRGARRSQDAAQLRTTSCCYEF